MTRMYTLPSKHHGSSTRPRHAAGMAFTLIELSVVLIIISLILGGGLASFIAYAGDKGAKNTEQRLIKLQRVLQSYRETYGRLPCPADITDTISDANFGFEAGYKGECSSANFQYATDNDVVAGLVPVRALGLMEDMAFDSWGSRIFYSVDRRFTNNAGFTQYDASITGKIDVEIEDSTTTASAVYILLSHGANRHGAYPRGGGSIRTSGRDPAAAQGAGDDFWIWEMENCDCDDGTAASATFDNDFVQAPLRQDTTDANDVHDDILVFRTRPQMEFVGD